MDTKRVQFATFSSFLIIISLFLVAFSVYFVDYYLPLFGVLEKQRIPRTHQPYHKVNTGPPSTTHSDRSFRNFSLHSKPSLRDYNKKALYNITVRFAGRLGNNLFEFAALLGIANMNNLNPVVPAYCSVLKIFAIDRKLVTIADISSEKLRKQSFRERKAKVFDHRTKSLIQVFGYEQNVELHGYYQSFKYFQHIESRIRSELQFLPRYTEKANAILRKISSLTAEPMTFVGIHIRRGDFTTPRALALGRVPATKKYFLKSMLYMKNLFKNVYFIAASNDKLWPKRNLGNDSIFYSEGLSPAEDLALLASCNHSIISSGTFSWWAGWLANGTTIYYAKFPPTNTWVYSIYKKEDYYPSHWLGF